MTTRGVAWLILPVAAFVALAIVAPQAAAIGWRVAFLTIGAPVIGAVLMLAIATLTGARWPVFVTLAAAAPLVVLAAIGIGVIQLAALPPAHLWLWQQPLAVGLRAVVAAGLVAWAGARLVRGATPTFAAIFLTIYAVVVTAIGSDWMLGGAPGHAVSAVGMMLFTEEFGGACAVVLLLGWGDESFRRDMGKLLVAAGLGLSYLVYMDFLILWYGDVPSKVAWYVERATPGMDLLVAAALLLGLFGPIAALALMGGARGQRLAGLSALIALALFNLWWAGGGWLGAAAACFAGWSMAGAGAITIRHRLRHAHG